MGATGAIGRGMASPEDPGAEGAAIGAMDLMCEGTTSMLEICSPMAATRDEAVASVSPIRFGMTYASGGAVAAVGAPEVVVGAEIAAAVPIEVASGAVPVDPFCAVAAACPVAGPAAVSELSLEPESVTIWRGRPTGSGSLTSRLMRGPSTPAASGVGVWDKTMPEGPGAGM